MLKVFKFLVPVLTICLLYSFKFKTVDDQPVSMAYYRFQHIKDTTQSGRVTTEDFYLAFNSNKSIYLSKTKNDQDSIQQAILRKAEQENSNVIDMGIVLPTTPDQILATDQSLSVIKAFNGNNYLIKEDFEKISWKIDQETSEILGYKCQKATGKCKGRTYTAWFTTDIPASFGPWKLNGLPGLILEAFDTSGRIKFTCTKILNQVKLPANISLTIPADAIATTQKDYNRMENAYRENSGMGTFDGGDIRIESTSLKSTSGNTGSKRFKVNFPLEIVGH